MSAWEKHSALGNAWPLANCATDAEPANAYNAAPNNGATIYTYALKRLKIANQIRAIINTSIDIKTDKTLALVSINELN